LIYALKSLGGRLDAPEAAKAVADLLARLDQPHLGGDSQEALIFALDNVGGRLDAAEAAKAAADLRPGWTGIRP
jgi:hypothetical protein